MTMQSMTWAKGTGNANDVEYQQLRQRMQDVFETSCNSGQLFRTNAKGLWEAYLESFPEEQRKYHDCSACKRFILRYGGLVTISPDGTHRSAIWTEEDADPIHRFAFGRMMSIVQNARVTSVFCTSHAELGTAVTKEWVHFALHLDPKLVHPKNGVKSAYQVSAEKTQDFKNVMRALDEFSGEVCSQAVTLLKTETLYRSERVLGPAEWLLQLHKDIAKFPKRKHDLVWRAVGSAPSGFCHPRTSMIGTLLEDLQAGKPFREVAASFKQKMDPLRYQRPQAPPTAGNIEVAEKIVAKLGIERSLQRRFARIEECELLWSPRTPEAPASSGGVFSHLKPRGEATMREMDALAGDITWAKFRRDVLPSVFDMKVMVPSLGAFTAFVTAVHADAPPILQWDRESLRNPVSGYTYGRGTPAHRWNLQAGQLAQVTGISLSPWLWNGGDEFFSHLGMDAVFIIQGARDTGWQEGGAGIFPEILKQDFHEIRATIEAFSKRAVLDGYEASSACGILARQSKDLTVLVTMQDGVRVKYRLDRWE